VAGLICIHTKGSLFPMSWPALVVICFLGASLRLLNIFSSIYLSFSFSHLKTICSIHFTIY
jgi:hypothetical protein